MDIRRDNVGFCTSAWLPVFMKYTICPLRYCHLEWELCEWWDSNPWLFSALLNGVSPQSLYCPSSPGTESCLLNLLQITHHSNLCHMFCFSWNSKICIYNVYWNFQLWLEFRLFVKLIIPPPNKVDGWGYTGTGFILSVCPSVGL